MRRVPIVLIAFWTTAAGLSAQAPPPGPGGQTPARDTARSVAGTATISGVVRADEPQGRPLRRVTVALQAADLRAPIAAVTDDDGRFVLRGVVAGHYTVMASRPGYVNTILGAKTGSILGAPIAVADGQDVSGLTIRMPRGSVITGAVRYASGRPASNVQVQVSPVKTVDGRRRTRLTTGLNVVSTDDRGVYRHFGLPPGDYLVQLMTAMGPGGPGEALRQTTSGEVAWAERVASAASPAAPAPSNMPPPGRLVLPAPIYYPGTTDIAAARVITLGPGEEREAIDLVVDYMPTARLSGKVFDLDGRPRGGVTVRLNGKGGSSLADMLGALVGQGGRTDEDGAFAIDGVPPGEYTLTSLAASATDAPKPAAADAPANLMSMFSGMFGRGAGAGSLYAAETVTVAGQDISNLELRLREGVTVSGTIVFEGTAARPSPGTMQIVLSAAAQSSSPVELAMSMMQAASAPVGSDLTFSLKGVVPNRYRATVNLPGSFFGAALPNATWTLKSIRAAGNDADMADLPFEIDPGRDLSGVVVTLTDRPVVLSGKVLDAEGRPSSAFPIIVFSTNPAHWSAGSRRVQQVRPASDGSYRLAGLPAGEYYVGAVTAMDLEDLFEPAFLQQIVPIAFRLTLADGEPRTQDLKLGGG
jgi:hypothetical protein